MRDPTLHSGSAGKVCCQTSQGMLPPGVARESCCATHLQAVQLWSNPAVSGTAYSRRSYSRTCPTAHPPLQQSLFCINTLHLHLPRPGQWSLGSGSHERRRSIVWPPAALLQTALPMLLVQCSCSCCAGADTTTGPCAWRAAACLLHSIQAAGAPLTFSSMKLRQPSLGTKAAIFLPFLISCTRAHFLMAELGCLASMPLQGQHRGGSIPATSCCKLATQHECQYTPGVVLTRAAEAKCCLTTQQQTGCSALVPCYNIVPLHSTLDSGSL